MTSTARILLQSLVRPFYRQNAGQLLFVFILFFGAVGELEGTQIHTGPLYQFHYQYALILGLLTSHPLLMLVLLAWLVYAEKCTQFVLGTLQQADHHYLQLLNQMTPREGLRHLFRLQSWLFLPITLYTIAILGVAVYTKHLAEGALVIGYLFGLLLLGAARYRYQLAHPGRTPWLLFPSLPGVFSWWKLFVRYLIQEHRLLFVGIKIISCGMLLVSVSTLTRDNYDLRMPAILFNIGIFGHSILVYKCRELEEKNLLFYRGLPVCLSARLIQYALLYALLLVPEIITLVCVTPRYLQIADAWRLGFCGYSVLLLMNSLLFVAPLPIRTFLQVLLGIFLLLYFFVLAGWVGWLCLLVSAAAMILFMLGYYRYDVSK